MPPGGLCPGCSPLPRPPIPAPCPPFASPPHFADNAKGGPNRTAVGYAHGGPSDGHRHLITAVVIGASVVAFFFLVLLPVSYVILRRRQLRRRQQALLAAGGPAGAANADDGDDPEGGGGVVHHVWYIQTVGLDEAAINSIAVTQYRAGAGFLGSADCSVCLGEFQDGELVRLLPKCGHAFHVPCIDTWLRAHVNCPICRSDVLDPSSTAAAGESNPPADANAGATGEQAAGNGILEPDEEDEQEVPPVQPEQYEQFSSPELLPQLPASRLRDVRRAASMDAAIVSAVVDVAALERLPEVGPEEEQGGREKRGNGAVCDKVPSCSGHLSHLRIERSLSGRGPRLFLSRHCRARSSVLPL